MPKKKRKSEKVQYGAHPGARFSISDAQILGEELEKIAIKHKLGGKRTVPAKILLKEATSSKSRLHRFFSWDDASEAHKNRLWVARQYLSHLTVIIEDVEVPAYSNGHYQIVTEDEEEKTIRTYMNTEDAMSTKETRAVLLKEALDHIRSMRSRFARFKRLANIFKNAELQIERLFP